MIHIYTGDGKGKTTCALGMCLRARGRGLKVLFIQFMKSRDTGELKTLEQLGVEVRRSKKKFPFYSKMTGEDKKEIKQLHNSFLEDLTGYDLIVFDEINVALHYDLVDKDRVMQILKENKWELVLTGRYAKEEIISLCDYATDMEKIKHPFDENISAREGIEY